MTLSSVNQARWARFRHNRRGYWSLWIFAVIFLCSLCAELIANDRPLLVSYQGSLYAPVLKNYSEKTFGGEFATTADYQDPWLQQRLENNGWVLWAPIRFAASSINYSTDIPFPSPPSKQNWLGTDANGRDVLARILYGTRISLLFGLIFTLCASVTGVLVGAIQGYYGGRIDLWGQRFIEVWSGMPTLFLIILLSSVVQPNFWWLLGIMALFSWLALVDVAHSVLGELLLFRRLRTQGRQTEGRAEAGTAQQVLHTPHLRILWGTWHVASVPCWALSALLWRLGTAPWDAALGAWAFARASSAARISAAAGTRSTCSRARRAQYPV